MGVDTVEPFDGAEPSPQLADKVRASSPSSPLNYRDTGGDGMVKRQCVLRMKRGFGGLAMLRHKK